MTHSNAKTPSTLRRALFAAASTLALSVGVMSQAHAVSACKIDVFVKNEQSASVKVLKFFYTVNGHEYHESLVNKRLAPGETAEWPNQALAHAAEGNWISNTHVEFKPNNSGAGDGYGPVESSEDFTHSSTYTCLNDRNYWLAVR